MSFEKIVEAHPAYDKRDPDPKKNYGIHGVDLRFVLKGEKGAVQFVIYTNWHLLHVTQEFLAKPITKPMDIEVRFLPQPADVGYHSLIPQYDGQKLVTDKCPYLDGKPCYYDGSGLNAERVFNEIFVPKGIDGLWEYLEGYYNDLFNQEQKGGEKR